MVLTTWKRCRHGVRRLVDIASLMRIGIYSGHDDTSGYSGVCGNNAQSCLFGGPNGLGGSYFGMGLSSCLGTIGAGGGSFRRGGDVLTTGKGLGSSSFSALGGSVCLSGVPPSCSSL